MADLQGESVSRGNFAESHPAASVAWFATILLAFLYWFSILDRFIISLLVDPIKQDLGITDLQFGLLHGFAFMITFSLFGLVAGALADQFSRRWIIFASVSIWSLATTACGFAQNFFSLLLARVGVGAGEAGLNPCATSMITDLFPRNRLTSALAVYAVGASVGSGCAYLLGGLIVQWVSSTATLELPIVGEIRSWQAVFFIVGLPGLLFSLLIFTIPEPVRRGVRTKIPHSNFLHDSMQGYKALLKFIATKKQFFLFHYAGFAFAAIVVVGCGVWYPAHMGRTFGWGAAKIGLTLGVTLVIGSIVGKLLCGWAVDALYRRGHRDPQLRWHATCLLIAVPVGIVATTSSNPWVFLGGLSLLLILISSMPVCASAALNLVTPNEMRGAGIAFFAATSGLVGSSLGPLVIAGVSDHVYGGNALGLGLATTIGVCCPIASFLLFKGCSAMRAAVMEAEA